MDKRTILGAACIVSIGLYSLGWTIKTGIVAFKDRDRIVTVKGLAEREVKAEKLEMAR